MTPPRTLLDTSIIFALMQREPVVMSRVEDYLNAYGKLNFSVFTRYEVLKSLKTKVSPARLRAFTRLCMASILFELTDGIVERASDIYADLQRQGEPIDDATALIAATALVHEMAIATNNEEQFSVIEGLRVENWLWS